MKRTLSLLLILLATLPSIAQEPTKQESPTLEETTTWLREKLSSDAGYSRKESNGETTIRKFEDVSLDGCKLSLTDNVKSTIGGRPGVEGLGRYSVLLADIDPVTLIIARDQDTHTLKLYTVGNQKKVRSEVTVTILGRSSSTMDTLNFVEIPFSDEAMAKRVLQAFKHAIELCKNKKQPF